MATSNQRTERVVLLALLLCSIAIRTAVVRVDRVVRWDEPDYLIAGRNLFTGNGLSVASRPELHYAPLFSIVTGALYPLTHDMKLNSDLSFVVFGTLALLPFYWLARHLFGQRVAWIAVLLLATFPALNAAVIFWGTMLEPLYLFLLLLGLSAAWLAWERGSWVSYLLAGVFYGLAYLTKPEAIVGFILIVAFLLVANVLRRSFGRRAVLGVVVCLLSFMLVISPYMVFLYRHTGRIMLTGKLGVTYVAGLGAVEHDPGLYDRALSRLDQAGNEIIWFSMDRFKYSIGEEIARDVRGFIRRLWTNVNTLEGVLFSRRTFPFYFLGFLSLAWFGSTWDRQRAFKEVFLLLAAAPVLVFLPFHIELRYFAPALPILLIWLACGIEALLQWAQGTLRALGWRNNRPSHLGSVLCAALVVPIVAFFMILQPRIVDDGLAGLNTSRRAAGQWLAAHTDSQAMIMSRDTEVPFYAERKWAATPNEPLDRFVSYVRQRGAQYVVVDEREATVIRPQLHVFLDESTAPVGFRHVYTAAHPLGKTVVYEVLP